MVIRVCATNSILLGKYVSIFKLARSWFALPAAYKKLHPFFLKMKNQQEKPRDYPITPIPLNFFITCIFPARSD
jgi:hypothetical protein